MQIVSTLIVGVMVFFSLISIIDQLFMNGKLGYAEQFNNGISIMGPTFLGIAGIMALVPIFSLIIESSISPLYGRLGLDPAMAVTTILANDMGGYQLANAVANDPLIGKWAGAVYGSMMGATIVFSIPVGLAAIEKEDVPYFSRGILFGIAAIPVGTFVSGLVMGIPFGKVVLNLIPPIIFSALIIFCLLKFPKATTEAFKKFSNVISIVGMLGLGLAMVKDLVLIPLQDLGLLNIDSIPFFNLLGSTMDGIVVAGNVGLILSGALPFIYFLNKALAGLLKKISDKTGFTNTGVTGFLSTCANNMATFAILKDMKGKEKIVNVAFAVCAAFVIGDHLAFTAANAPDCIVPMMIGKLVSGICAVILAMIFVKD